jgi:hypothetical protein
MLKLQWHGKNQEKGELPANSINCENYDEAFSIINEKKKLGVSRFFILHADGYEIIDSFKLSSWMKTKLNV